MVFFLFGDLQQNVEQNSTRGKKNERKLQE